MQTIQTFSCRHRRDRITTYRIQHRACQLTKDSSAVDVSPKHQNCRFIMSVTSMSDNYPRLAPSSTQSDYDTKGSTGVKRRRQSQSPTRTTFTDRTKTLVAQRCEADECWNCEARGVLHYCHVIAQSEDSAVSHITHRGRRTDTHSGQKWRL